MTTRALLEIALGLSLGYFIAAVGNALLGDPLGYLGRRALRWLENIGDATEASHRGQRDTWAAEPDQLPEPDKPRHRKDQS